MHKEIWYSSRLSSNVIELKSWDNKESSRYLKFLYELSSFIIGSSFSYISGLFIGVNKSVFCEYESSLTVSTFVLLFIYFSLECFRISGDVKNMLYIKPL